MASPAVPPENPIFQVKKVRSKAKPEQDTRKMLAVLRVRDVSAVPATIPIFSREGETVSSV